MLSAKHYKSYVPTRFKLKCYVFRKFAATACFFSHQDFIPFRTKEHVFNPDRCIMVFCVCQKLFW